MEGNKYLMLENKNGYIPTNWDEDFIKDIKEDGEIDGKNWERLKNLFNMERYKKLRIYEVILSEQEFEEYFNSEKILLSGNTYTNLGKK